MPAKFHWIPRFLRRNKILLTMLVSSLVLGTALIAGSTFVLFKGFEDALARDSEAMVGRTLGHMSYVNDRMLMVLFNTFFYVSTKDPVIFDALNDDRFSEPEILEIYKKFNLLSQTSPLIHSISLCSEQADLFLSSGEIRQSYQDYREVDPLFPGFLYLGSSGIDGLVVLRKLPDTSGPDRPEVNLVSLVFGNDNGTGEGKSALIANIQSEALLGGIRNPMTEGAGDSIFFIVNSKGLILSHDDSGRIGRIIPESDPLRAILASTHPSASFIATVDGRKSLVSHVSSDVLDWHFVALSPYSLLAPRVRTFRSFSLFVSASFIILGLLAGAFFVYSIYRPIYQLKKKLDPFQKHFDAHTELDEIAFLDKGYEDLIQEVDILRSSLGSERNDGLVKLFKERITESEDIRPRLASLGIDLEHGAYLAGVLRCEGGFDRPTKEALSEAWKSECPPAWLLEFAELDTATVGVAFGNLLPGEGREAQVAERAHRVLDLILADRGLSMVFGLGQTVESLSAFPQSFAEAMEALEYRMLRGPGPVYSLADIRASLPLYFVYPAGTEKSILALLRDGKSTELRSLVFDFLDRIGTASVDEALGSLSQLCTACMGLMAILAKGDRQGPGLSFADIREHVDSRFALRDIGEWLVAVLEAFVGRRDPEAQDKKRNHVETLIRFIQSEYSDPNLSADILADRIGLSLNHIRLVFKEKTGLSLSDYINNVRYEKACALLASTDWSATKIAQTVGFSNVNYFYVRIKTHTGMTLDRYRKLHRKKS